MAQELTPTIWIGEIGRLYFRILEGRSLPSERCPAYRFECLRRAKPLGVNLKHSVICRCGQEETHKFMDIPYRLP
jgi:hypothetical protein